MSKTNDQIRSEMSIDETRSEWGAWSVVAGLVLEIVLATAKSLGYEDPNVENWGGVLADCLIALGVYAEIHFGRKASQGNAELRRRADERSAKLEKEAADARGRVADIERLTAWRRVSDEQAEQIASAIGHMADEIDLLVEYERADPESWAYSLELTKVFVAGGVKKIRRVGNSYVPDLVFGIHMAASSLINFSFIAGEFSKAKISAQIDKMDLSTHLSRAEAPPNLYVFVGPKPLPAFEEWVEFNATRSREQATSATREQNI
jgi:hypothetical protein